MAKQDTMERLLMDNPKTFEELAATVVDRVITLAGLEQDTFSWGEEQ